MLNIFITLEIIYCPFYEKWNYSLRIMKKNVKDNVNLFLDSKPVIYRIDR